MTENLQPKREVAAVFDSAANLEEAVDDLLRSGFDRAEISLMATEGAIDAKLAHTFQRREDGEDESRAVYVSKDEIGQARKLLVGTLAAIGGMAGGAAVVATGGALAPAFLAALLGGGAAGAAGEAATYAFERERVKELEQRLQEGGILLFVTVANAEKERSALDVMGRHSPHRISVHEAIPNAA